jgi:purine-binding chemotaxis protein CheW
MKENLNQGRKYLSFKLADEEYGIAITRIKEMIGMMEISIIHHNDIKRVIPFNGRMIPVIDLRAPYFTKGIIEPVNSFCIVVVEINRNNNLISIGLVVDSLSGVMFVKNEQIDTSLNFEAKLKDLFITGRVKTNNKVKILLNIDKIANKLETIELIEADSSKKKWLPSINSSINHLSCLVVAA